MSLQTHTFFLDTTHAAPQGPGSWRFQMREPIEVRQNQVVHVDDVTLKNSFPTVDTFSNRMYLLTTWMDPNATPPDLSGNWNYIDGYSTTSLTFSAISSTVYEYTIFGQNYRWTITAHDNVAQTFSVNIEIIGGSTTTASYDPSTARVTTAASLLPPDLSGSWTWHDGSISSTHTFTPVPGSNTQYLSLIHI